MTLQSRFFWKLFLGHAVLAAIILLFCVILLVRELEKTRSEELRSDLDRRATALASLVEERLRGGASAELQRYAHTLGSNAVDDVRITVVLPDGRVLADSETDPARMGSHADRPEIIEALRSGVGRSKRWSRTVSRDLIYVAIRMGDGASPLGVVRVARAAGLVAEDASSVRRLAFVIGLSALLAAILLALGLSLLWSARLRRLTAAARSLARGHLDTRLDASGHDEVALLARALNRMRDRIARQLDAIDRERGALESILTHLGEGVIVVGPDGRIILINSAARRFLNLPVGNEVGVQPPEGWTVEQCIPEHELQRMVLEPISSGPQHEFDSGPGERMAQDLREHWPPETDTREVRLDPLGTGEEITVLARVTPITLSEFSSVREAPDVMADQMAIAKMGRLLVLTDITEWCRTIKMKTDFVANASHELRTPLTAIRASVETLTSLNLASDGPEASKFLDMIGRHSRRLEALATDLLALARVESPGSRFQPTTIQVKVMTDELRQRWGEALAAKQLRWLLTVDPACQSLNANPYLLNLVLDNLVDNAIKFTPSGGEVALRVEPGDSSVYITVTDSGCGIPKAEQERVFERFYQVSSIRGTSTAYGTSVRGTGLGLSIVRHAVAAMRGTVALTSAQGKGTTIVITLPAAPNN
jgi:two-component system, OmpR family, phosphate regulon sensor histidine kinase PhoR